MTAEGLAPAPAVPATTRESVRLRPGWITIAAKELADHLLSIRLYVLLVVLGIAALIPLYFVGEDVRSAASSSSACVILVLGRWPCIMSQATLNSSAPPAISNAAIVNPKNEKMNCPATANATSTPVATTTALYTVARRSCFE